MTGNLTAGLKVRLDPGMREELEQRAARSGVSAGWLVRRYVAAGLKRDRVAGPKPRRDS